MATMYDLNVADSAVTTVVSEVKFTALGTWPNVTLRDYYVVSGAVANPDPDQIYVIEVTNGSVYAYVYVNAATPNYALSTTFAPNEVNIYQLY